MTGWPGGAACVVADGEPVALLEDIIVYRDEVSNALLI
jgi:hypothetical protein